MKEFWKQNIPKSRNSRNETADIGILITSRKGDGTIMQPIRIAKK